MLFSSVYYVVALAVQILTLLIQFIEYMMRSPKSNDKTTKQPNKAAFLLTMTIIDTVWRTFVPTIGATLIGIGIDKMLMTAPLYTTLLVVVGFIFSALLVMQQLKNVKNN